jgi:hypothetical protein
VYARGAEQGGVCHDRANQGGSCLADAAGGGGTRRRQAVDFYRDVLGAREALAVESSGDADIETVTRDLIDGGAKLIAVPTTTPWQSLNSRLSAPGGLITRDLVSQQPCDLALLQRKAKRSVGCRDQEVTVSPRSEPPRLGGPDLQAPRPRP